MHGRPPCQHLERRLCFFASTRRAAEKPKDRQTHNVHCMTQESRVHAPSQLRWWPVHQRITDQGLSVDHGGSLGIPEVQGGEPLCHAKSYIHTSPTSRPGATKVPCDMPKPGPWTSIQHPRVSASRDLSHRILLHTQCGRLGLLPSNRPSNLRL